MSKVKRVYSEKMPEFAVKAKELSEEISSYLNINTVTNVRVFIFIGCLQVHAEKSRVAMEKWQTGNVVGSTTVCRSPMKNSIDVYYDDELRQIKHNNTLRV